MERPHMPAALRLLPLAAALLFAKPHVAQTTLWTDTYNGGIVVGTFSIGDQGSGIGMLYMALPAGATIRQATLYSVSIGATPDTETLSCLLGPHPITFDASTAGPSFNSTYGEVVLHSVDLTMVLDPAVGAYVMDVTGDLTSFKEFMLFTRYELAGAGPITVDLFHCGLDSQMEEQYAVRTSMPMSTDAPIAFGTMGAYAGNEWTDYERVFVNGTELGSFYGRDQNAGAGNFFGACATFHYANGTFAGVSDDNTDQTIAGADVLSDLVGLVLHGAMDFDVTYRHSPTSGPRESDNIVNLMVVAYSGDLCALRPDLGPDTVLCHGGSFLLDATIPGASYTWQDGSTSPVLNVTRPGTYHITYSHPQCTWPADTIVVDFHPQLLLDLGPDRSACVGETVELSTPATSGASYVWADGIPGTTRSIDTTGTYELRVSKDGCSRSDAVNVVIDSCHFAAEMPNVFTPNGDGDNDEFMAIKLQGVESVSIDIFNRWGQKVFTSTTPGFRWSGHTEAGLPVSEGTYFWVLSYVPKQGDRDVIPLNGHVTLLR